MKASAMILLLAVAACPPGPAPYVPPTPPPGPSCSAVCAHWLTLGCKEANPSPNGVSCTAVCENVQGSGIIEWDLACRASISSCADVDSCER